MMNQGAKKYFWEKTGAYCRKCGYNKSIRALHCHHLDKKQKQSLSDTLAVTLGKGHEYLKQWCKRTRFIILCANCHGELHDGFWDVPNNYPGDNQFYANTIWNYRAEKMIDGIISRQKDDGINRQSHRRCISLPQTEYVKNYII